MRLFIDLISGAASVEWPVQAGGVSQTVKALTGERVEIRFMEAGVAVLLPTDTALKLSVRATKTGALLAELDEFTAPETAAGGFYEGRLSFATTAVQTLLDADSTKNTFAAVAAVSWTIPAATEPEESDDLTLTLLRKVGSTAGEDPLVLSTPWDWLKLRVLAGSSLTRTVDNTAQTLTFTVGAHTHIIGDVTGLQTALDAKLSAATAAATYEPIIGAGASGQYWRGDKTWQTLNASAVGLGNVSNALQLVAANNLSDLASASTARGNLGLGDDAIVTFSALTVSDLQATSAVVGELRYLLGEFESNVVWPVMTANRTLELPDASGVLVSTGDFATVTNAMLANSSITINGTPVSLGGSTTISTGLTIGGTAIASGNSGRLLYNAANFVGELALGTGVQTALGNATDAASGLLTYGIIGTSGTKIPLLNAANTFSALQTINGAANTQATLISGTITGGSQTRSLLKVADDWTGATGGTSAPTLIEATITDTGGSLNYAATSFLNFKRNGSSVLRIDHGGTLIGSGPWYIDTNGQKIQISTAWGYTINGDVWWYRDAAGVWAQRNSTSAQALRIANTYTSSTNNEYFVIDWQTTANTLRVGTVKGSGGGTARPMALITDGTARINLAATGEIGLTAATTLSVGTNSATPAAGLALTNATAAIAGTQSASPTLTLTGQGWKTTATAASQAVAWEQSVLPVQGTTNPSAIWRLQGYVNGSAIANPQIQAQTNGPLIVTGVAGVAGALMLRHPDAYMGSAALFTLGGSGDITIAGTLTAFPSSTGVRVNENGNSANYLRLYADASIQSLTSSTNIVSVVNSTTAQMFRVYGTYTDASNYVRLALNTTSTALTLAAETAGTGADDVSLTLQPVGSGNLILRGGGGTTLFTGFNAGGSDVRIGFYATTAVAQPSRIGQLTDSSGGTSGGSTISVINVDVVDAASCTDTKNAIATLAAKINALEAVLSAAGGGIGITA